MLLPPCTTKLQAVVSINFSVTHLDGPRFVNLERQVPDASFVQDDGARFIVIESARTDDLVEGY